MKKIGLDLTFEIVCNECEGTGFENKRKWNRKACPKCFGIGKVDWIENIIGKKRRNQGKLPEYDARIISWWKLCLTGFSVLIVILNLR